MSPLHHLVVGPPGHGVVRYAELLLAGAGVPAAQVVRVPTRVGAGDVPGLVDALDAMDVPAALDAPAAPAAPALGVAADGLATGTGARRPARVHLHVTDHLLGRSPEEALDVVRALAARGPVSLTLHDLPQRSDGTPAARRRACYAGLVEAAVGVVVSSDHEAALLAAVTGPDSTTPVRVVPLAVPPATADRAGGAPAAGPRGRQVAVLGWVYPGKGHAEVLAALDGLPEEVGLRVVGRASPGHDDLVEALRAQAEAAGRTLVVDGWVDDDALPGVLAAVDVPVHAPRHVSASASLTAWLAAGRRPVTVRSTYTEEVGRRAPGTLLLVDDEPGALAAGIRQALDEPALTRLDPGAAVGLHPAEAARLTFAGWQP